MRFQGCLSLAISSVLRNMLSIPWADNRDAAKQGLRQILALRAVIRKAGRFN